MYLYPIPAFLALAGFIYILFVRPSIKEVRFGLVIAAVGMLLFLVRSWQRREWPFSGAPAHKTVGEAVQ
jgi:hypothetical protein